MLHPVCLVSGSCLRSRGKVRHASDYDSPGAKTGKCELRTNSFVTRILADAKGRPTGVQYYDIHKQGHEQYADLIVVCLLRHRVSAPASQLIQQVSSPWLGNSSGQVGQNLTITRALIPSDCSNGRFRTPRTGSIDRRERLEPFPRAGHPGGGYI